jgi:4-hydroxy-tetrahydrodipicolinate synthase
MAAKQIRGIYTAVLAPRKADDSIDKAALARLVDFLLERGIEAFAINGATGEFCLTTPQHLRTAFSVVRKAAGDANILCGIGAAGTAKTLELAKIAAGEGAQAALLPMPYFFPYSQDDLAAYVETVAAEAPLPVILYNLPDFTTPLETETACKLIKSVPNVIGIKDSGKSLATLRKITKDSIKGCRIVGNDGIFADALREKVCDGVVSGVSCALPELIRAVFAARQKTDSERFQQLSGHLDAFRKKLGGFPVPWGLKWIAQARGVFDATFSQPLAASRLQQGEEFMAWFEQWKQTLPAKLLRD